MLLPVIAGTRNAIHSEYLNNSYLSFTFAASVMVIPMIIDLHYVAVIIDRKLNRAWYLDSLKTSVHRQSRYDACQRILDMATAKNGLQRTTLEHLFFADQSDGHSCGYFLAIGITRFLAQQNCQVHPNEAEYLLNQVVSQRKKIIQQPPQELSSSIEVVYPEQITQRKEQTFNTALSPD